MTRTTTSTTKATAKPQGSAPHPGGLTGRAGVDGREIIQPLLDGVLLDRAVRRLAAYIRKNAAPFNNHRRAQA